MVRPSAPLSLQLPEPAPDVHRLLAGVGNLLGPQSVRPGRKWNRHLPAGIRRRWRDPIASSAVAILVIRNSRYPRKAFPDKVREGGIVVRVASAIIDVAKLPEFCEGQRRVNRPELVGAFRDKAV